MTNAVNHKTRSRADNKKRDDCSNRTASLAGQPLIGTLRLLAGCIVFIASVLIAVYASQVNATPADTVSYNGPGLYPWLLLAVFTLFPLMISFGLKRWAPSTIPFACQSTQHVDNYRPNGRENDRQPFRQNANIRSDILDTEDFSSILAHYWATCMSQSSYLALFIVQIDNFSQMADVFGHQETRQRLQQMTHSLNSLTRSRGGIISDAEDQDNPRLHVLLPNTTPDEAHDVAEEMRLAIEDLGYPAYADGRGIMTASLGLAVTVPDHDSMPYTLRSGAERALDGARQQGHNRVMIEILGDQSRP